VVGLVSSEPLSDPLIEAALRLAGLGCIRIEPERGKLDTLRRLWACDIVAKSFGAYSPGYARTFAAAKFFAKRVLVYWIGSDVLHAAGAGRVWTRRVQRLVDTNLTVTAGLRAELASQGVRAEVIPIVSDLRGVNVEPLPARFAVLAYLPAHDHVFYGSATVSELARRLPAVDFLVVGGWRDERLLRNLIALGFVSDMSEVYRRSSVLLRLTPHDGLPKMVLEALAWGRRVIWSQPFPHCMLAQSVNEAERAIVATHPCQLPNQEGAEYVLTHHAFEQFSSRLAAHIRGICRA
jgi:glycosyltransferase involved in cell wall biosynthesis